MKNRLQQIEGWRERKPGVSKMRLVREGETFRLQGKMSKKIDNLFASVAMISIFLLVAIVLAKEIKLLF
jgi:hypothetical protein